MSVPTVNDRIQMSALAEQAVARTSRRLAVRFRGISDRAIAWLFIAPTVLLLLAINLLQAWVRRRHGG